MPGPTIGELAAGIVLDTKRFEAGIVATKAEIRDAGRVVKAAQTPLENYAQEIDRLDSHLKKGLITQESYAKAVANAEDKMRAAIPEAEALGNAVGDSGGGLGGLFSKLTPTIDVATVALKAGELAMDAFRMVADLGAKAIENMMEQAGEIDRIVKFADTIGFSTETIAGLEHAAGLSGSNVETLQKALEKFTVNIGRGSKEFAKLNLNVEALQKMDPEDAFLATVDAIAKLPTAAERAAAAYGVFGRSAVELLPLLTEGSAGIQTLIEDADKLGLTFSEIDAGGVEQMNDNLDRMAALWDGIGRHLAVEFAPVVSQVADTMIEMVTTGDRLEKVFNAIAIAAELLAQNIRNVESAVNFLENSPALQEFLARLAGGNKGLLLKNLLGGVLGDLSFDPNTDLGPIEGRATDMAQPVIDIAEDIGDDLEREAEQLNKELMSPMEKLAETLNKLNQIQEAGLLDEERLAQARQRAYEQFDKDTGRTDAMEQAQRAREQIEENMRKSEEKIQKDKEREAEQISKSVQTPQEKLTEQGEKLFKLFDEGLLSKTDYDRAVNKATDEFLKSQQKQNAPQYKGGTAAAVEAGTVEAYSAIIKARDPALQEQKITNQILNNLARKINPPGVVNAFS